MNYAFNVSEDFLSHNMLLSDYDNHIHHKYLLTALNKAYISDEAQKRRSRLIELGAWNYRFFVGKFYLVAENSRFVFEGKKSKFAFDKISVVIVVMAYNCSDFDFATEIIESSVKVLWILDCYRRSGLWKYHGFVSENSNFVWFGGKEPPWGCCVWFFWKSFNWFFWKKIAFFELSVRTSNTVRLICYPQPIH